MTLQFRWSEADYVSARWALLKSHPARLALAFWYPAAMLIAIGIGAVENPSAWRFQLVLVLISVGFTALLMLLRRWIWRQEYKKTPFWREEVWAVIDGQSIKLQGETFGVTYNWGELSRVYDSVRVFVFEEGKTFVFLPKEAMNQSQLDELRSLITSSVKCKVDLTSRIS